MKESIGNEGETVDRTHDCGRWKGMGSIDSSGEKSLIRLA